MSTPGPLQAWNIDTLLCSKTPKAASHVLKRLKQAAKERPQDSPRLPKMALPGPQHSPKTAQDGPKTAQNEPKTAPSTLSGKIFVRAASRLCRLNKGIISP